jgi:hypothetical protein
MSTAEIVKVESAELAMPTPMRLIELAVQKGADPDQLGKLLDLQMRWEANEAKKAFVAAMNDFAKAAPEINKNRHVKFKTSSGVTEYDHATLDNVVEKIGDALQRVGVRHSWETGSEAGRIRVTCILTHALGHSEKTTLEAGPDASGGKNSIQAIGSTVTYLQRYTLLAATGLATKGADDDGKTEGLSANATEEFLTTFRDSMNLGDLQRAFNEAYQAAKTINDTQAMQLFIQKKDERKTELK